jgi:hypothetical protein
LEAHYAFLFADGTYFAVIYDGAGQKMPILAVIGIKPTGEREVLAFTVGERENKQAWEDQFDQLKARGLQTVALWITDGHHAMLNALQLKFPDTPCQRCVKHKLENILGYILEKQQDQAGPELKALFYQANRAQADQAVAAFCARYATHLPHRRRVSEAGSGRLSDLLCLPAGALEDFAHHERHRMPLQRGEAPQPQDGARLSKGRQLLVNVLRRRAELALQENCHDGQVTRPALLHKS